MTRKNFRQVTFFKYFKNFAVSMAPQTHAEHISGLCLFAVNHRRLFYQLLSVLYNEKLCKVAEKSCRFERAWQSAASYLAALLSDKLSSHMMTLQRRYDLSGLEWLSSPDCGQRDEE